MAARVGIEPTTLGLTDRCYHQLSYLAPNSWEMSALTQHGSLTLHPKDRYLGIHFSSQKANRYKILAFFFSDGYYANP